MKYFLRIFFRIAFDLVTLLNTACALYLRFRCSIVVLSVRRLLILRRVEDGLDCVSSTTAVAWLSLSVQVCFFLPDLRFAFAAALRRFVRGMLEYHIQNT